MKFFPFVRLLAVAGVALWFTSCGGGGDSSGTPDVGDNDIGVVLCIGDSITDGGCRPAGAPYPSRLAALSGKTCINAGSCGAFSGSTAGRAPAALAKYKPGYLCLLVGANDASTGYSPHTVGENIRRIIQAAKAQQTIVLVATLTPTVRGHAYSEARDVAVSAQIRVVVREEGARLVDLEREFGLDESLLQKDGLHPSDSGTQLIALSFNDKL